MGNVDVTEPLKVSKEAKIGLSAAAALSTAAIGLGLLTKAEVPDGQVGVCFKSSSAGREAQLVEPGSHWYGLLRFPNMRFVTPGQERHDAFSAVVTPGTLNKMTVKAQEGLFWRSLPGIGSAIQNAKTHHLEFDFRVRYTIPQGDELKAFLERAGTVDFENGAISRIAHGVLDGKESEMKARVFEPKVADLERAVSDAISAQLGLKAEVSIAKITKFSLSDKDHAPQRQAKGRAVGEAGQLVAEVIYALVAR